MSWFTVSLAGRKANAEIPGGGNKFGNFLQRREVLLAEGGYFSLATYPDLDRYQQDAAYWEMDVCLPALVTSSETERQQMNPTHVQAQRLHQSENRTTSRTNALAHPELPTIAVYADCTWYGSEYCSKSRCSTGMP
jgi:hypothetical protein